MTLAQAFYGAQRRRTAKRPPARVAGPRRRALLFESLEPRVLLSADHDVLGALAPSIEAVPAPPSFHDVRIIDRVDGDGDGAARQLAIAFEVVGAGSYFVQAWEVDASGGDDHQGNSATFEPAAEVYHGITVYAGYAADQDEDGGSAWTGEFRLELRDAATHELLDTWAPNRVSPVDVIAPLASVAMEPELEFTAVRITNQLDVDADGFARRFDVAFDVAGIPNRLYYVSAYEQDGLGVNGLGDTALFSLGADGLDTEFVRVRAGTAADEDEDHTLENHAEIRLDLRDFFTGVVVQRWTQAEDADLGGIGAEYEFRPFLADARVVNRLDADGNGYARTFDLEIDADGNVEGNVYFKVYDEDQFGGDDFLAETATFEIDGVAPDFHAVTIHADWNADQDEDGSQQSKPELRVELWDATRELLVQTWRPADRAVLGSDDVRLEPEISITDARIVNARDDDGDGYNGRVDVEFDVASLGPRTYHVNLYEQDGTDLLQSLGSSTSAGVDAGTPSTRLIQAVGGQTVDQDEDGTAESHAEFWLDLIDDTTSRLVHRWTQVNDPSLAGIPMEYEFRPQFEAARITNQVDDDGNTYARRLDVEFDVRANVSGAVFVRVLEEDADGSFDQVGATGTFTVDEVAGATEHATVLADFVVDQDEDGVSQTTAEFRLELYDATTGELVQTWRPDDDGDLGGVRVEPELFFVDAQVTPVSDVDGDGFAGSVDVAALVASTSPRQYHVVVVEDDGPFSNDDTIGTTATFAIDGQDDAYRSVRAFGGIAVDQDDDGTLETRAEFFLDLYDAANGHHVQRLTVDDDADLGNVRTEYEFRPRFADARIVDPVDDDGDTYMRTFDVEFDVTANQLGTFQVLLYEEDGGGSITPTIVAQSVGQTGVLSVDETDPRTDRVHVIVDWNIDADEDGIAETIAELRLDLFDVTTHEVVHTWRPEQDGDLAPRVEPELRFNDARVMSIQDEDSDDVPGLLDVEFRVDSVVERTYFVSLIEDDAGFFDDGLGSTTVLTVNGAGADYHAIRVPGGPAVDADQDGSYEGMQAEFYLMLTDAETGHLIQILRGSDDPDIAHVPVDYEFRPHVADVRIANRTDDDGDGFARLLDVVFDVTANLPGAFQVNLYEEDTDGSAHQVGSTFTLEVDETHPVTDAIHVLVDWYVDGDEVVGDEDGALETTAEFRLDLVDVTTGLTVQQVRPADDPDLGGVQVEPEIAITQTRVDVVQDENGDGHFGLFDVAVDVDSILARTYFVQLWEDDNLFFDDLVGATTNLIVDGAVLDEHAIRVAAGFAVDADQDGVYRSTAELYLQLYDAATGHLMQLLRPTDLATVPVEYEFRPVFDDARITNRIDDDGNGYARRLDVEFDVDGNVPGAFSVNVYEEDADSAQIVSSSGVLTFDGTALTTGRATVVVDWFVDADEDVVPRTTAEFRLDLVDAVTGQVVQVLRGTTDSDLQNVQVEPEMEFTAARIANPRDGDGDGIPRRFDIEFDVDSVLTREFSVQALEDDGHPLFDDFVGGTETLTVSGAGLDVHAIHVMAGPAVDQDQDGIDTSTADFYLRLLDAATGRLIQVWRPAQDADLGNVPVDYEFAPFFRDARIGNLLDDDADGAARQFDIEFDVDSNVEGSFSVFAYDLDLEADGSTSEDFLGMTSFLAVDGAVVDYHHIRVPVDWNVDQDEDGAGVSRPDLRIDLFDATTGRRVSSWRVADDSDLLGPQVEPELEFAAARIVNRVDVDGDGFASRFDVEFDVNSALARTYSVQVHEDDLFDAINSDDFLGMSPVLVSERNVVDFQSLTVHGGQAVDQDDDGLRGSAELILEVYDGVTGRLMQRWTGAQAAALAGILVEPVSSEGAFNPAFTDARVTNPVDLDGDGFARTVDVEFAVESALAGSFYVKVYEADASGAYDFLAVSETFTVGDPGDYHAVTVGGDFFVDQDEDGTPESSAEFALFLYDEATDDLVQVWRPGDDPDLVGHAVEPASHDFRLLFATALITNVVDEDADDRVRQFDIQFDVDSFGAGTYYVAAWEDDGGGGDDDLLGGTGNIPIAGVEADPHTFNVFVDNFPALLDADDAVTPHVAEIRLELYDVLRSTAIEVRTFTLGVEESADDFAYQPRFASASIVNRVDRDGDGHARRFDVAFDVDAIVAGSSYVRVWEINADGTDAEVGSSPVFTVDGAVEDPHTVTVFHGQFVDEDEDGSSRGAAELRIEVYDAATNRRVQSWTAANAAALDGVLVESPAEDLPAEFDSVRIGSRVDLDTDGYARQFDVEVLLSRFTTGGSYFVSVYEVDADGLDDFLGQTALFGDEPGFQHVTVTTGSSVDADEDGAPHGAAELRLELYEATDGRLDTWTATDESSLGGVLVESVAEDPRGRFADARIGNRVDLDHDESMRQFDVEFLVEALTPGGSYVVNVWEVDPDGIDDFLGSTSFFGDDAGDQHVTVQQSFGVDQDEDGKPDGTAELRLELFEASDGLAQTLTGADNGALDGIAVESIAQDPRGRFADVQITRVDQDGDGAARQFDVEFLVEALTPGGSYFVYVWEVDAGGVDDFMGSTSFFGDEAGYQHVTVFQGPGVDEDGSSQGSAELRLELFELSDGLVQTVTGADNAALGGVPVESAEDDEAEFAPIFWGLRMTRAVDRDGDGYASAFDVEGSAHATTSGSVFLQLYEEDLTGLDDLLLVTDPIALEAGITRTFSLHVTAGPLVDEDEDGTTQGTAELRLEFWDASTSTLLEVRHPANDPGMTQDVEPASEDPLQVTSAHQTPSGVEVQFNGPVDPGVWNLYDTETGGLGPADVTLVGDTHGAVRGTLFTDGTSGLTFVKTGGALLADRYTLTLRSADNGIKGTDGILLDGDTDGIAGGNYVTTFVVAPPARVISAPDFARGTGQVVNVPATGSGIPITVSDMTGVTVAEFDLRYDPTMLTVSGVSLGAALTGSAALTTADLSEPGLVRVRVDVHAPVTGAATLVTLAAQVPDTAVYRGKEILDFTFALLNQDGLDVTADDGVHVVTCFGDTTGNGAYSSLDGQRVLRVAVGLDTGFSNFPLVDPVILGDITGNGSISSLDATRILQEVVGIDRAEIPPRPTPVPPLTFAGADPAVQMGAAVTAAPGAVVTVPVNVTDTAAGIQRVDLEIRYDAGVVDVAPQAAVRTGTLTPGASLAYEVNASAGTIAVELTTVTPLAGGTGSLVEVDYRVRADATPGTTALDLVRVNLNEDALAVGPVVPQPGRDATDGEIRIDWSAAPSGNRPAPSLSGTDDGTVPSVLAFAFQPPRTGDEGTLEPALIDWEI